jgi:transposase-like protein
MVALGRYDSTMSDAALELAKFTCRSCGQIKPASEFGANPRRDGYRCKLCDAKRVRESQERLRARIGEEAYRSLMRERVARSRAKRGNASERTYNRARWAAILALIEAHPKEFEELLRRAKYEAGLPVD